jgi:type VI secretion system protein ImpH
MADEARATPPDLAWLAALEAEPYRFGFFAALRRLECMYADRPRIGAATRPAESALRLGQEPSLDFPPATLAAFRAGKGTEPHRLLVRFLGLFGPHGPLPLHLTEYARDRLRNADDRTFAYFADVFHDRVLALFFRAWAASQPTVSLDRAGEDRFGVHLASLLGLGMPELRDRDAWPDFAKLHYAGHLASQSRHPDGLASMIGDYFGLSARIVELVGEWLVLSESTRLYLGARPESGCLGLSTVIGARVWERQHKFRVVLGPVGLRDYTRLLPGGDSLARLIALVRNYVGDQFSWDLQLVLRRDEVPRLELGRLGRLGWTTWLHAREPARDADDLLLQAQHYA